MLVLLAAWVAAAPAATDLAIPDKGSRARSDRRAAAGRRAQGRALRGGVPVAPPPHQAVAEPLAAYENLASWVDIYDEGPWKHPRASVLRMKRLGAKTLFVQTSNYGAKRALVYRDQLETMVNTAHRAGMRVVAWSVPSFGRLDVDFKRVMKAINFKTDRGHTFDSFALDIEATVVRNIHTRNHRLLHLTQRIRRATGDDYPLGAIVPDPLASRYWPEFPWKMVANYYDVFLPMGYFTYQANGPRKVFHYTAANIRIIRRKTQNKRVPIHVIGGIASTAAPDEVRGFVRAVRKHRVIGASLYDYPITSDSKWAAMRPVTGLSPRRSP